MTATILSILTHPISIMNHGHPSLSIYVVAKGHNHNQNWNLC